jgi:hypothetical protein
MCCSAGHDTWLIVCNIEIMIVSQVAHVTGILVCYVQDDKLLACYLNDVRIVMELRCHRTGAQLQTLSLPESGIGQVDVKADPDPDTTLVYYRFTSPTNPGTIYRCGFLVLLVVQV